NRARCLQATSSSSGPLSASTASSMTVVQSLYPLAAGAVTVRDRITDRSLLCSQLQATHAPGVEDRFGQHSTLTIRARAADSTWQRVRTCRRSLPLRWPASLA